MFIVPITQMSSIGKVEEGIQSAAGVSDGVSLPFSDVFKDALENAEETRQIAEQDAYDVAIGKVDDLHTVMINSEKATAALELTVQLTTKAVNAYNEIMRMQI